MKRLIAIVGVVVLASVIVALVALSIVGLDPHERRPGLWLRGEHVPTPVADWSFTDKFPTIYIQTRTWYLLPHSVTITCVAHQGQLYLTSVFLEGAPFPQGKFWTANVMHDPHVRLKIGRQVFDETLVRVTDPAERAAVLQAKAKKYPGQRVPPTAAIYLFHVVSG